MAARAEERFNI